MNSLQFSIFEGEFFAIFSLWGWILFIFTLYGWILSIFYPLRVNSFAIFPFWWWILCNFQPLRVNSFHFYPSRVNSLHFLLFEGEFFVFLTLKGEFFAIFTLQGWILFNFYLLEIFLWVKRTKNYSFSCEFFEILIFILVIGVFLSGILCVLFWHKSPVFFWVICWHFLPFKRVFFTILFFIDSNRNTQG